MARGARGSSSKCLRSSDRRAQQIAERSEEYQDRVVFLEAQAGEDGPHQIYISRNIKLDLP